MAHARLTVCGPFLAHLELYLIWSTLVEIDLFKHCLVTISNHLDRSSGQVEDDLHFVFQVRTLFVSGCQRRTK